MMEDLSSDAQQLVGTFAGYQIRASEELRAATNDSLSKHLKIQHLKTAAMNAEYGVLSSENTLQRMLCMAQYQAACSMLLLVRNDFQTTPYPTTKD